MWDPALGNLGATTNLAQASRVDDGIFNEQLALKRSGEDLEGAALGCGIHFLEMWWSRTRFLRRPRPVVGSNRSD